MASIKSKNTKPEILIRKELHARGYRYRLHNENLPGKPDIVFPMYAAVIFINGCFWHGHNCHIFKAPRSNIDFWESKISRNKQRDTEHENKLTSMGWRIGVIWECSVSGKTRLNFDSLVKLIEDWLHSSEPHLVIEGSPLNQSKITV
jgi:DNA mismatch endonuclease (patch repair protein)